MEPMLVRNHISYPLAIAVIFPELVRYSALRDKMEITLLKALYINLGDEYANFSIGQFQMKPSFAEIIRRQAPSVLGRRSEIEFKNPSEYEGISYFRKSIVSDLEDPRTQLNYLIVFFKICEKKYKTNRKDEITGLKFDFSSLKRSPRFCEVNATGFAMNSFVFWPVSISTACV